MFIKILLIDSGLNDLERFVSGSNEIKIKI